MLITKAIVSAKPVEKKVRVLAIEKRDECDKTKQLFGFQEISTNIELVLSFVVVLLCLFSDNAAAQKILGCRKWKISKPAFKLQLTSKNIFDSGGVGLELK